LNNAEVEVAKSGRVPITLMVYVPIGLNYETIIAPVSGSILMKSVPISRKCPSELSTPAYVHAVPYVPQLSVAENGVI
jgi:hypothetical protein